MSAQCPKYIFDIIQSSESFYDTRKKDRLFFNYRTDCPKYSLLSNFLSEWSQLAPEIKNLESIVVFKSKLLSFIRPSKRSIFNVNDPEGVKYLTRLRLRFSHWNEHKFRHGFLDTLNPLCNCSLEVEDNEHFFLRCLNFENARRSLFIRISSFKNLTSHLKVELLLFIDSKLSAIDNNLILKASSKYIMTRVGIKALWFVNHESISQSHEPKTSIFQGYFFRKLDNFKIISKVDICLSICRK